MTNGEKTPARTPASRPPAWANALLLLVVVAVILGFTEVFLRYQPFVILNYAKDTIDPDKRMSFLYHHRSLTHDDPQTASLGACDSQGAQHVKLLFLGDSWMESTDGIPRGFVEDLIDGAAGSNVCYEITNGGTRSFAPSLHLIKGRKLIAENAPDFVVVYIDETDIMDEQRYSRTTLRGPDGEMERVIPGVADLFTNYEKPILIQQRWYTLRLLEQVYYEKVILPRILNALNGSPDPIDAYERIMAPQLSANPEGEFGPQLAYFRATFREMLSTFVDRVGKDRILIARHPHFLHLSVDGAPPRYNESLSKILAEETASLGVTYYDAGRDLQGIYGDDPAHYMRWPADPFSHLTDEGSRLFGRWLGKVARAQVAGAASATRGAPAPEPGPAASPQPR